MKRQRRNILPSVPAVPILATSPEAGRKWPKPLRRGRMENVASFLILAGTFLLMQSFSVLLYAYSFMTILIGTAMFIRRQSFSRISMASIQVSALHKRFDDFVAVNGSDFTVQHGEFFSWDRPVAAKRQPCG